MTKKVKPAKKAKKPADKTPEITKAAKALENYLKENNLDPAKDWSKDKTHGKAVKELMAKLNKERDKVAAQYPEKDTANQKKLVKMKKASEDEKKAKKEAKAKEKSYEILKLEKRIEQLEKRLKEAEMKEGAYNIMVEIIKEEYGIDVKKNTVSSGRIYER